MRTVSSIRKLIGGQGTKGAIIRSGAAGAMLQITSRVLALLTSALLARALGVEGYGVYAFAIAITGMASIVAEMGMGTLALRETATAPDGDAGRAAIGAHLRAARSIILAAGVVVMILGAALLQFAPLSLSGAERTALMLSLPLTLLAALTRTGVAILAGLRRLVLSQLFEQVVTPLLVFAGALVLFLAPPDWATAENAILIQLASGILAVVGLAFALRPFLRSGTDAAAPLPLLAKKGLPFLTIAAALVLNQQLDTILVGLVLDIGEVGPYRVASQGAQLAMFVTLVINTIISPYAARYYAADDHAALRRLFVYARFFSSLSIACALVIFFFAGRLLVTLLFGEAFADAAPLLIILTLGYLGNALAGPCGTMLTLTGHERHIARAMWVTAGLNAALATAAGLTYGIYGIATVTALTLTSYQLWLRYIQWRELRV